MANLIDIRRRIKSTKNTKQITRAMKLVSASRLRRASERATEARPYAERLLEVHRSVIGRMEEVKEPLYLKQDGPKTLLIVLAGDKGLCGSFNANIFKAVDSQLDDNTVILPVGQKAVNQYKHRPGTLEGFPGIFRKVDISIAEQITKIARQHFLEDESISRVELIFNKFKNVLVQETTRWQLLPLVEDAPQDEAESEAAMGVEHLAEPSLEQILADLTPRVITTRVYQALLESCAAEHAARMTAMDAATRNAGELIAKLTLDMNKARQAAITTEIIEIVSGAAAL